jgi:hypothetical protein
MAYKDRIRWEFDWAAAERYRELEPDEKGNIGKDRTIRRRTPSPKFDSDGNILPTDDIFAGSAMGFWKPYTGYTLGGEPDGPLPGWEVEKDPSNVQGFRRKRNADVADWKQKDRRTFEVRMKEPDSDYFMERLTHPLPDDKTWMKVPVAMKGGVITKGAKPVEVACRMRLVNISVRSQLVVARTRSRSPDH